MNVVLVVQLVTEAMAGVMQHAITLHVIMIQIHKAMPWHDDGSHWQRGQV